MVPDGDRVFIGDKDLVLEAQVAPDVRVFSNMHAATQRVFTPQEGDDCPADDDEPSEKRRCFKRQWGRSVFGTVMIRLRMFKQDSNPVKTPSFMPKVTFQFVGFKSKLDLNKNSVQYETSAISVRGIRAVLGHHSNGQDGCPFVGLRPNEDCESIGAGTELDVNTEDGSFSTNYLRMGSYWGVLHIGDEHLVVGSQKGLEIALEYHPCGCSGGGWLKEPIRSRYGDVHLQVTADYSKANLWGFQRFELPSGIQLRRWMRCL